MGLKTKGPDIRDFIEFVMRNNIMGTIIYKLLQKTFGFRIIMNY